MDQDGFTEAEWLAASDVDIMLGVVGGGSLFDLYPFSFFQRLFGANSRNYRRQVSRKLRLFACACCRQLDRLLENESREAIQTGERLADGIADDGQVATACTLARAAKARLATQLRGSSAGADARWNAAEAVVLACSEDEFVAGHAMAASQHAASAISYEADQVYGSPAWEAAWSAARKDQAGLVLDVFGNPFRPGPTSTSWPTPVVKLADGLYNGKDCGFAMHDALLEAGRPDLADHFKSGWRHCKGCWAVDLVLGQK